MLSFIERLRKAPLSERRRAGAVITFVVVGLVALVWVGTLFTHFNSTSSASSGDGQPENTIQGPYE